jgi:aldehyde dehydrogenase (NAD+)
LYTLRERGLTVRIIAPSRKLVPRARLSEALERASVAANGHVVGDLSHAARQLRAGHVHLNYQEWDTAAPFGDYKQSGNGRENAEWGIHDFLEVKAIIGYGPSE